jgi:hypothetical protein
VKQHFATISVAVGAVIGAVVLSPDPASAASPSPASSCTAQLNQGATPHGLSGSEPGFLGAFASEMAKGSAGTYGAVTSSMAGQHGGLFACLANVQPLG